MAMYKARTINTFLNSMDMIGIKYANRSKTKCKVKIYTKKDIEEYKLTFGEYHENLR